MKSTLKKGYPRAISSRLTSTSSLGAGRHNRKNQLDR